MSGQITNSGDDFSFNNAQLHDVTDPTSDQDVATKKYVDDNAGGGVVTSVFGRTGAVTAASNDYSEAQLSFTDITTNDSSTSKHGFLKKLDNNAAHFMDGQGNWSTPAGTSPGVAADPIWAAAGDIVVATGNDAAAVLGIGASGKVPISNGTTLAYGFPPGYELDYVEITSGVSITATTEASPTNVISGNAVSYDGSTRVCIEFYAPRVTAPTDGAVIVNLWDGSTDLGRLNNTSGVASGSTTADIGTAVLARRFLTPSNAAHTYHIKAWRQTANGTIEAGAGGAATYLPAYLRITKA